MHNPVNKRVEFDVTSSVGLMVLKSIGCIYYLTYANGLENFQEIVARWNT